MRRIGCGVVFCLGALALAIAACQHSQPERTPKSSPPPPIDPAREPDVVYWATPEPVVDKMLELAKVTKHDLVYDLGCGDARILVTAAKRFGARGYGVDIDPKRVEEARENARKNGVEHLVKIEQRDVFTIDLSPATVVTLYLLPGLNERLIPQLEKLEPGSRIISHQFPIPGIEPDQKLDVDQPGEAHVLYLWRAPLKVPAKKAAEQ